MKREDLDAVIRGAGGNHKLRFEWGHLETGEEAIRTSQGRSKDAGVTSEYLQEVPQPGFLVHGTSLNNARSICTSGLERPGRLHIHFGTLQDGRPVGVRPGSEVIVVVDVDACKREGIPILRSANNVFLSECHNGSIAPRFITQVFRAKNREVLYTNATGWIMNRTHVDEHPHETRGQNSSNQSSSNETLQWDIAHGEEGTGSSAESYSKYVVNPDPFDGQTEVKVEIDSDEEEILMTAEQENAKKGIPMRRKQKKEEEKARREVEGRSVKAKSTKEEEPQLKTEDERSDKEAGGSESEENSDRVVEPKIMTPTPDYSDVSDAHTLFDAETGEDANPVFTGFQTESEEETSSSVFTRQINWRERRIRKQEHPHRLRIK